jgi:hypothetical protein
MKGARVDFVSIQGGPIKEGKLGAAQKWLAEHEAEIAANSPEGTEYVGTYVAVFSSEDGLATSMVTLMHLDSYGAMDTLAASGGTEFGELTNEFVSKFFDQSNAARPVTILLKRLTDATIWGED